MSRLGEAAALQVCDVDFLRRRVFVNRQVQRGPNGTAELRAPTHGSERTVVVPDRLLALIAGHVERHLPAGGPHPWSSHPERNAAASEHRRPPLAHSHAAAGVSGPCLHDLRHLFA